MTEANDHAIDKPFHSAGEVIDVLGSIPLAEVELPAGSSPLNGRELRMRRITLAPGGVIAAHPHDNRPAILYVVAGTVLEFSGDRDVATEHTAPAIVIPRTAHWWRNPGDHEAIIIGADLFDPSAGPAPE